MAVCQERGTPHALRVVSNGVIGLDLIKLNLSPCERERIALWLIFIFFVILLVTCIRL